MQQLEAGLARYALAGLWMDKQQLVISIPE
jgi:hypothetical protein